MKTTHAYAIVLAALHGVQAAPTASNLYLGGGLTILSNRTENSNTAANDGNAAIQIFGSLTFDQAKASCGLLYEELWNPDAHDFNATLRAALAYQRYLGIAPWDGELWWVTNSKSNADGVCRAIGLDGHFSTLSCQSQLSVLCTNSAPASTDDDSVKFRVDQFVNQAEIRGYRDLHSWKFKGLLYADPRLNVTDAKLHDWTQGTYFEAVRDGPNCVDTSTNCLYTNIWTPFLPPLSQYSKSDLKAVKIYFTASGPGRISDNAASVQAATDDVVVVSMNYRVGADKAVALQWVHKYIRYFGGDEDRVTVVN